MLSTPRARHLLDPSPWLVAAFVAASATASFAAEKKSLRVYHVGNSVTDTIRYGALQRMAASRGHEHVYGRHMIPGAPLEFIWKNPTKGVKEPPFGYYPAALPNYQWDAITLQPFDRQLKGDDGDLQMARNFLDLAFKKSRDLRVYVYQRWPKQSGDEKKGLTLDYPSQWARKYTGKWDHSMETRDYFERLSLALREAYPGKKVFLVPVGDVMLKLDERMRAGKVKGYDGIGELYTDKVHLNNVGAFVVGTTFFATLYGEDPAGLDPSPYRGKGRNGDDDIPDELAKAVQEVVWQVVSGHPMSGVDERSVRTKGRAKSLPVLKR